MRDKLDGLCGWLVKMSRVPGLGFLEGHADSLTGMKHTVEGHIGTFEMHKQGLEEGVESVKELARRNEDGNSEVESSRSTSVEMSPNAKLKLSNQPTTSKRIMKSSSNSSAVSNASQTRRAAAASKDAKEKQKLAMRLLKRNK